MELPEAATTVEQGVTVGFLSAARAGEPQIRVAEVVKATLTGF